MATAVAAVRAGWKRTFEFRGRSSRSDFWWWQLFAVTSFWVPVALFAFIVDQSSEAFVTFGAGLIVALWVVITLPSLSVLVRRFHDVGYSGWWAGGGILIAVIISAPASSSDAYALIAAGFLAPIWLAMLVVTLQRGAEGENRFGEPPTVTSIDNNGVLSKHEATDDEPKAMALSLFAIITGAILIVFLGAKIGFTTSESSNPNELASIKERTAALPVIGKRYSNPTTTLDCAGTKSRWDLTLDDQIANQEVVNVENVTVAVDATANTISVGSNGEVGDLCRDTSYCNVAINDEKAHVVSKEVSGSYMTFRTTEIELPAGKLYMQTEMAFVHMTNISVARHDLTCTIS